ncbi:MAG TPA: hypothetical protein PKC18_15755, partial [Lacipirellulaceae bacterium]|nr:hypothetical protein [Lacipirellulaceae bacterium]
LAGSARFARSGGGVDGDDHRRGDLTGTRAEGRSLRYRNPAPGVQPEMPGISGFGGSTGTVAAARQPEGAD